MQRTIVGLVFLVACALRQAVAAPDAAAADSGAKLEEIVVTATKRETSLQDTPIAISAFTEEALRASGVEDISDLGAVAPNVTIGGHSQGASNPITIRGVGANFLGLGADDAVAVYVDGVYYGRQYGAISELPDVSRIEVLRGPQGTLYGRNATGGAISVVSRTPSTDPTLSLDVGYGNLDEQRASLYASTGIGGDRVAIAAAGSYRKRDGYSRNLYDGQRLNDLDSWAGKVALRWLASDDLDIVMRADVGEYNSSYQAKDISGGEGDPDVFDVNYPGQEDRRFSGVSLQLDYRFAGATLTSITAYRKAKYFGIYDSDGTAADLFRLDPYKEDQSQTSEEIRLASNGDAPLQWIAGLYYFHEDTSGLVHIPFVVFASDIQLISANRTNSFAAFGEVSYRFSPGWKATVGLRYTDDRKSFDFEQIGVGLFPSVPFSNSPNDASAWTPRFVLEYKDAADRLYYASISRGFKSGGFSAVNPIPFGSPQPFTPEYLWAYEIGAKMELLEHRLRWNSAAFFYDYKDMQVRVSDQYGFVVIQNAGAAEIKGVETEIEAQPVKEWQISGSIAYLDAKYTKYISSVPGLPVVDLSGNTLFRAPKWSFQAATQYTWTLPSTSTISARAEYFYKTEMFYTEDNRQPYGRGPEGELSARLTYAAPGSRWSVSLYGNNLTDNRYRTSVFDVVGAPQALYNLPRTYGAEFHFEY